ncbi:lipid asymmetry maintenance protein MlaB [Pokkaliibacter sp. CJK22405]|uniref:STAS domain-containing protein n=1 Tax=Pokkaliibacter sp. CJK22405 TaxID=3384615 RepID=UPI003984BF87
MQVERTNTGIKLAGELSFVEAAEVVEQACGLVKQMQGEIEVDLSELHTRSMVVLGVLLQLARTAKAQGVDLTWSGVTPSLKAIFDLTDVSSLLLTSRQH